MSNQRQPRIDIDYTGEFDLSAAQSKIQAVIDKASKQAEDTHRQHSRERHAAALTIQQQAERIKHLENELIGMLEIINRRSE